MEQQVLDIPSASSGESAATDWRSETAQLLRQSIPNIATSVLRLSMGIVDFMFCSRLGTDAQAAISPSTIFCFIIIAFGIAISSAVTTFAAQAVGRRQPREAAAFACQTAFVAVTLGLLSAPLMLLMKPLFAIFGSPAHVQAMEVAYCRIGVWSIAPAVIAAGFEGFFTGIKKPGMGTIAIGVALASNTIWNYLLVFGHFGFPRMGIAGSSIATLMGWCIRAGILLVVFLSPRYAEEFGTRHAWTFSWDRLSRLVKVGAPTALQWVMDIGAWFVFTGIIMGRFGTAAMAAANTTFQYMSFSFMPAVGVGIALCAAVGHAIGERDPERAVRRATIACVMVSLYMGLVGIAMGVAGRALIGVWSTDAEVIRLGGIMMVWAGIFQIFDGLGIVFNNALRGAGDTRWPTVAFGVTSWGVFIGGGWMLMRFFPGLGVHGPWATCTLYVILLGIALWARFKYGPWRQIKLFHDPIAAVPAVAAD